MTENEKIIISLLRRHEHLSKQLIAEKGDMGWATSVKMINRLLQLGIIRETENSPETEKKRGKQAVYYSLERRKPLAVGVDIEYSLTRIILTNLHGDILGLKEQKTPQHADSHHIREFLFEEISSFIDEYVIDRSALVGIGIGIPGLIVPHWLKPDVGNNRQHLSEQLASRLGIPVRTEINVRAYAHFLQWSDILAERNDFLLVSIRTGLGTGIVINNSVYTGQYGIAGELGHFPSVENGKLCRCGKRGCLETVVNQRELLNRYYQEVLNREPVSDFSREELDDGLAELFEKAAAGVPGALKIIRTTAQYLGKALSYMVMTLYTPDIFISAKFGPYGGILVDYVRMEMSKDLLPHMTVNLRYHPFTGEGFTQGAAMLLLSNYLSGCSV